MNDMLDNYEKENQFLIQTLRERDIEIDRLRNEVLRGRLKLDQLLMQQSQILKLLAKQGVATMGIKEDVDNLVAEVEENTTVVGSAQTLLTQLTELLTNLKGQVADPTAQAALQQAIATLDANNKAIAAAITANTPSA